MTSKANRKGIFHLLVEKIAKGDDAREMYLWDICYRYEVYFCLLITILLMIPIFLSKDRPSTLYLALPCLLAMVTIIPLYEGWGEQGITIPSKREDIGQFRSLLACVLGAAGMVALLAFPFLPFYHQRDYHDSNVIAAVFVLCAVHYLIVVLAYVFVHDYVKWRFDWAVKNYELLWSWHYRWWTTGLDYEVQKTNLVVFRSYKVFAGTLLLAGPLCMFVGYYLCKWMGV